MNQIQEDTPVDSTDHEQVATPEGDQSPPAQKNHAPYEHIFDIASLAQARRLPHVGPGAEIASPQLADGSVHVFRSAEGETLELVLAWDADLQHQPDGLLLIDPATGMCLAAKPLDKTDD